MKRAVFEKMGDFLLGKGFYIVLFLCVTTIGVSGYYLLSGMSPASGVSVIEPVTANPSITIPTPSPVLPTPVAPKPVAPAIPDKVEQSKPTVKPTTAPVETTQTPTPKSVAYTWPVKGEIIRSFDGDALSFDETMGDWRSHTGLDIRATIGTQVLAVGSGIIKAVLNDDMMGTTVIIDHENGTISVLSNLSEQVTVAIGDGVDTGTVIGVVGSTALAEITLDPHLHLEMTKDGTPVDPTTVLPKLTQ